MAACIEVGHGAQSAHTLFWMDIWIHGHKIETLAPRLFALVPNRRANKRTVLEVLSDNTWIGDLHGALLLGFLQN